MHELHDQLRTAVRLLRIEGMLDVHDDFALEERIQNDDVFILSAFHAFLVDHDLEEVLFSCATYATY
jgi:hypothetical protein